MKTYAELVHKRCKNHPSREAAVCCPQCAQFFCRECVTEHDDRFLCSACLKKLSPGQLPVHFSLKPLIVLIQWTLGCYLLWVSFYYTGKLLLMIPSTFHEGTFWLGEQ